MNDIHADTVATLQARLRPLPATPRDSREYRKVARWWELEATRGYPSADASRRYARNMRWASELAGLYGPGTWLDLISRAGAKNPESTRGER